MTISFNTIPSNTLVPLFYAEMDNQAANTAQDSGASLLIGHANNGAEIVANSLVLMPSADYARQICGAGSQLARMVEAYRQTDPFGELYVIAVPESTGAAATVNLNPERFRQHGCPEETTRSPLKQVPTLVSADDVTAQLLLRSPRSGIFAPPRLSGSYQQTPLCWGVASTCSRWAEKAGSASYFQAPLM